MPTHKHVSPHTMPLLHREATYKDKATTRPLVQNTPRTRIVVFLLTVVLLVVYSLHTLDHDDGKRLETATGDIRVSKEIGDERKDSTYQDSDVDFSKHGIDYSKLGVKSGDKLKSTSNNGVDESNIDRSLDSRVVGSIHMGSGNDGKPVDETKTKQSKPVVHADVTKAKINKIDENNMIKNIEEEKMAKNTKKLEGTSLKLGKEPTPHQVEPAHKEGNHLQDHLVSDKEKLIAQQQAQAADNSGKVLVQQFENGGVKVLDRINMAS